MIVDGYARNCRCLRRKLAKARIAVIPPAFNSPKLSRLKPRNDLHPSQEAVIGYVKKHPNNSYLLLGRNGTGKTHIAWAIYRNAIARHRPAVACAVRDLLYEFRRAEITSDSDYIPRVTAIELRHETRKPWLIFLDEFEKARPTEFASEMLFNLLDAAKSFNHQVIVTSNFTADQLRDHWSRIDRIWGNSIMTRLECCSLVEMF